MVSDPFVSQLAGALAQALPLMIAMAGIPLMIHLVYTFTKMVFMRDDPRPLPPRPSPPRPVERETPVELDRTTEHGVTYVRVVDRRYRPFDTSPVPKGPPLSLGKGSTPLPTDAFRVSSDPRRGPCPHCGAKTAGVPDQRGSGGPCCYAWATDMTFGR